MAIADFKLPCGRSRKDTNRIPIIIAYGPALKISIKKTTTWGRIGNANTYLWQETANGRLLCFIAGDFNGKVGLQSSTELEDSQGDMEKAPGMKMNMQALVDWPCKKVHFYAILLPTSMQTSDHLDGLDKDSARGDHETIYNQIDFILSQMKLKPLL